ncbi:MAG: Fic family protein [Methylocystis sp.]|uniref:Fic family protein n=1 Tax=Methylocystis sp. TaxID=1911079 RepID=UPI00393FB2EF
MSEDRHRKAQDRDLIEDPLQKALKEAENGIKQYEKIFELFNEAVDLGDSWKLRQRMIVDLQNVALQGIHHLAGTYRNSPVAISGSSHAPPNFLDISDEVAGLCDYVNTQWSTKTAIHLAAYVLWRMNWIHPFADGNGRTARAVSYLVLLVKLGTLLPGTHTIPEQIASNKGPYYDALEAADAAAKKGIIDVTVMEQMLESMLISQLTKKPNPILPGTERLKWVLANRIDKAPPDLLQNLYGTSETREQLWAVGNSIILQVSAAEDIDAAEKRFALFGDPFPGLIGDVNAQEMVTLDNSGRILRRIELDAFEKCAVSLQPGSSIVISNPNIRNKNEQQNWSSSGTLYIMQLGSNINLENISEHIDFLLARHFRDGY